MRLRDISSTIVITNTNKIKKDDPCLIQKSSFLCCLTFKKLPYTGYKLIIYTFLEFFITPQGNNLLNYIKKSPL